MFLLQKQKPYKYYLQGLILELVGMRRFELPTPRPPDVQMAGEFCRTQIRY